VENFCWLPPLAEPLAWGRDARGAAIRARDVPVPVPRFGGGAVL
jgi:hypothetical protein